MLGKSKKNTKIFLKIHQKNTKRVKDIKRIKRIKKNKTKVKSKIYYGGSSIYEDIKKTNEYVRLIDRYYRKKLDPQFIQLINDFLISKINYENRQKNTGNNNGNNNETLEKDKHLYNIMWKILCIYFVLAYQSNNNFNSIYYEIMEYIKKQEQKQKQEHKIYINNLLKNLFDFILSKIKQIEKQILNNYLGLEPP